MNTDTMIGCLRGLVASTHYAVSNSWFVTVHAVQFY